MDFCLRERRHAFDELGKFMSQNDLPFLILKILLNQLDQLCLMLILNNQIKISDQFQHKLTNVLFNLFTQQTHHFQDLSLMLTHVHKLKHLLQHQIRFFPYLIFIEYAKHVYHKLQNGETILSTLQVGNQHSKGLYDCQSYFQGFLHERFDQQRNEFVLNLSRRENQGYHSYFFNGLLFEGLIFQLFTKESNGIDQESRLIMQQLRLRSYHLLYEFKFIIFRMDNQSTTQNDTETHDLKPLLVRIRHGIWTVRKRAYEQILSVIDLSSNLNQQCTINGEIFSGNKLISIINNLVQQKHPNVLLKGLQCAGHMLKHYANAKRQFNKLVVQGLQKFPLVTQQRKAILQRFLQILQLYNIQPSILSNRLSLPHQKSVMYVIEVIGFLGINSLKPKLIEMAKKHPKKQVKQLAAEIARQLQDEQVAEQVQIRQKGTNKQMRVKKQQHKSRFKIELIQKLPHFDQLQAKKQQEYTESLLEAIDQISAMQPHGTLSNFCYYIQLMIELNNQIISLNGIKMLTALVKNNSPLISTSYPLLFLFRKFKMHKTHSTNVYLFHLIQALLCSSKSNDLMNAVYEGIGSMQNKIILKYGCTISFIRIFCYYYKEEELFEAYCIGEYQNFYPKIQNKKYVEKMLTKSFQLFVKEKDKEYGLAIQKMKDILGIIPATTTTLKVQKSSKDVAGLPNSKSANKINPPKNNPLHNQNTKAINSQSKPPLLKTKVLNPNSIISTQGQLNKILQATQTKNISTPVLAKIITKCLESLRQSIRDSIYDLFYYCQILESFIQNYRSREETDDLVSQFLVSYLKLISEIELSEVKRKSKITQTGLEYLFKLSISKLVLSKELIFILDNISKRFLFQMIIQCLYNLLVVSQQVVRKKNKKYLTRWLQENTSEQFIDNRYFELKETIQNSTDKKTTQKPNKNDISPMVEKEVQIKRQQKREQMKVKSEVQVQKRSWTQVDTIKGKYTQQMKNQSIELNSNSIKINYLQQKPTKIVNKKDQTSMLQIQRLQLLQNADISKIQEVHEPNSDRLDEKWQYFLNKKHQNEQNPKVDPAVQQQKYNYSQQSINQQGSPSNQNRRFGQHYKHEQVDSHFNFMKEKEGLEQNVVERNHMESSHNSDQGEVQDIKRGRGEQTQEPYEQEQQYQQVQFEHEEEQEQQAKTQEMKQQKFIYQYLNYQKINYMINNSNNPFNHLRTSILLPFKSTNQKNSFLTELTHLIQHQFLKKPQPFNSLLLVIILLFTEIKTDKSIIQNLQYLYQFMAQQCTNNEFLKTIIGLYHCVIDQTQQDERRLLLTILTKSMLRIMPHVENALELLKDFQQFYQIGQMVYFDMFSDDYNQIKQDIQSSENLQYVIRKAQEQQGQNLYPIIQGWLQTKFKHCIKQYLSIANENDEYQNQ